MTKDIDLDWHEPDDELLDTLLDAADHDAGDFFTFRIERAGPPEDRLGGSRRFRVSASLASREFETFLLDIGFRVIPKERVDKLTTPDLLAFADLASLDAVAFRRSSETTFAVRSTHPVPTTLPAPPPEWNIPFAELARTVGVPTDLASAHATAAELLDPILDRRLLNGAWDVEKRQWI